MNSPCYNCKQRKSECHMTCEKYIEYDKFRIELRLLRHNQCIRPATIKKKLYIHNNKNGYHE